MEIFNNNMLTLNFLKKTAFWFIILSLLLKLFWKKLRQLYYISFFPGPRPIPLIGNILHLRGSLSEISKHLLQLMHQYEPIFRFWMGPYPVVTVTSPDYAQKILTDTNALEKSWVMKHLGRPFFGDPILISDGWSDSLIVPKWKRNRKIVIGSLTQNALNSFLPIFIHQSEILNEQLKKEVGSKKPFNAYEYISRVTLDSVCGAAIGSNLNSQICDSPYLNAIDSELVILFNRGYKLWLYFDTIFNMTKMAEKQKEYFNIVFGATKQVIEEKRKLLSQSSSKRYERRKSSLSYVKKPFLDYLLEMTDFKSQMTDNELIDEVNIIILGAYETTAITLSYLLLVLAAKQDVQQKVYDEIFHIFGNSDRAIELNDLNHLKYLELVIKECMRLFPTVPYIIREATDDIVLNDNYTIPNGTTCLISIIGIHHNKEIWKNPMEFDPDRFLPDEVKRRHPFAYIPFSGGPRNCIGIRYAMMFMKVLLVSILRKYQIYTPLKLEDLEYTMALSLKLDCGHMITIAPREYKKIVV